MEYKSDASLKDFGELGAPLQKRKPGAVVGKQYCLQKAAQFKLENAIFSKAWSITNVNGDVVFQVRGKAVEWYKAKRELVDAAGNTVVLMEEKPWAWKDTWRAYAPGNPEELLFTLKQASWWYSFKPSIHIFLPSNPGHKVPDYTIKGKLFVKKCSIFHGQQLVAEVSREASLKNIVIDKSIFNVIVYPGVDSAFIFSLIVIMDKLYVHNQHASAPAGGGP